MTVPDARTATELPPMSTTAVDSALIERILNGYRTDAHVRRRLPGGGVLNIDRKLPYLFVFRQPLDRPDDATGRLVLGEASYLLAQGMTDADASAVVRALAQAGTAEFGSFLVLEIWAGPDGSNQFVVHGPAGPANESVTALSRGLDQFRVNHMVTSTSVRTTDDRHPTDRPPLLTTQESWQIGCLLLGLEVPPLHRDSAGTVYPVFLRRMRSLLSPVFRQAAFEFARVQTTATFESYRALGPRSFGRPLFDIDRELAEIERSYQFLLLVSPMNSRAAWTRFRDARYERDPRFHYRLLPVDPDELKRRLYALDLEHVADPAMAFLLRDKRDELDKQVTMLAERNTCNFRYASMRLYRAVDEGLLAAAHDLLATVPHGAEQPANGMVSADDFARLARMEIAHYRTASPDIAADVQVRPDLVGLMVSRGDLLIGEQLSLRPQRVAALLHHEVGTHVLTYYNGRAQPLRQLYTGLAGYDELQEGLAVFSEYLAEGLDGLRMRTLAARVVAAHAVEQGAQFIETFRLLYREHGFSARSAFDIAERVHQCGGFTRDLIYLRGLLRLLEYLRDGGAIEPLFIGKIAAKHVTIIDELRERGFLVPPPLVPRVFERAGSADRIDAVRHGLPLTGLIRAIT
jgi:uncharacterized protein (TIGR02421 family)